MPSPGKQSVVDHIRAPAAEDTVKTCKVPERFRVQATCPVLVTETPRTGRSPCR